MASAVEFYRHCVGEAEIESLRSTFDSVFLACGPRVAELEKRLAAFLGVPDVVGVSSCSMGLILSLAALGVRPGDEVITTPMTYVATSNAILHLGATCVFADCDPATGLIDPAAVRAAVTPSTRAIIGVHLYGQLADMRALRAIADERAIALVEDAAHAVEAERDGVGPGQLSDAAVFSFYSTKNLTSGDGGAIAVRSPELADALRRIRNHGVTRDAASRYGSAYRHWDMVELGYKAPLSDVEAAILLPQIDKLLERRALRQALVERYEASLRDVSGVQLVSRTGRSAHHLFAILVDEEARDPLLAALSERRIGCAVNYRAIHELTFYKHRFGYRPEELPNASRFGRRTISLPLWPNMPVSDVDIVVDAVRAAVERRGTAP